MNSYLIILIVSVMIASFAQVLLKKSGGEDLCFSAP